MATYVANILLLVNVLIKFFLAKENDMRDMFKKAVEEDKKIEKMVALQAMNKNSKRSMA